MTDIVRIEDIEERIITIQGEKVLLDRDVADIYNISTKEVNQAVANNPDKFPEGFIVTLTENDKKEVVKNFDHLEKIKFSPYLPKGFTEKSLYMLATIIKSKVATRTTLAIIETFAKIRHLSRNMKALSEVKDEAEQKALMQKSGEIIAEVLDDNLEVTDTETTVELNVAFLKFKHTVKKHKGGDDEK